MTKELNLKQEKFCQAYVLYRNATESAKIAGYSDVSAHTQGHRLVQRPDIQERIEELEKEIETNIDVVAEIENQYTYAKIMVTLTAQLKLWKFCLRLEPLKMTKFLSQ